MKPVAPATLDGLPLDALSQARFQRLLDVLYTFDPLRPAAAILAHAEAALRQTCVAGPRGWTSRSRVRLAGGRGPAMLLR